MTQLEALFDPGLQPERTALAWQRTILAFGAGVLLLSRILPSALGLLADLIALAGAGSTVAVLIAIHRRYRQVHRHLVAVDAESLPSGGRLILATSAVAVGVGVLALSLVLVLGFRPPA